MKNILPKRNNKNTKDNKEIVAFIKNIFGFKPGNIFLYVLALRHKSAAAKISDDTKDSNERLEFLGDAILGAIITDYLFKKFPYKDEGFLTETRSKIVSRSSLNKLAQKIGIDKYLATSNNLALHTSPTLLGDAFEAIVGAIYLDKGYTFAKKRLIKYIIDIHLNVEELVHTIINYKSRLIEWAQKEKKVVNFTLIDEKMLKNNQHQYIIEVTVDEKVISSATDYAIKGAEQLAAEKAWHILHNTEKET